MTVKLDNIEIAGWLDQALRELGEGPVVIERDGHPIGALIPPDMLELIERLEDASYRGVVASALAEPGEVSWEDVKAESRALP